MESIEGQADAVFEVCMACGTGIRGYQMAIWLVRAGSHGEYEQKFLQESRVYVTWDDLDLDLASLKERSDLVAAMMERYPEQKPKAIMNWVSQVWPFAHVMQVGDWVVLPLKTQPVIYIGELVGNYQFAAEGPNPYFHWRSVKWIGEGIPRARFSQDLLYSFGAFLTICRIQRNDAEARLKAMAANGWKAESTSTLVQPGKVMTDATDTAGTESVETNLEVLGNDQITRLIEARFKGHALTRLVDAILKAQGYSTYVSPEGADGGADILAGSGPMGFGEQRICVEVKSGSELIDRPTVDKLLGAMTKFNANQGLFVSWGGFKSNVQKELASSFYRLRLWGPQELLEQLFTHYDALSDEIKAELPLKRIWTVAHSEID
ncbi:restriction endonuclease [Geopseudomonas aromaticivorans]|nr:restriction endonuclease [Pseudomonas aromaticivorans]